MHSKKVILHKQNINCLLCVALENVSTFLKKFSENFQNICMKNVVDGKMLPIGKQYT